jgi:antitoxin component YwqK of YwqJK toxin-antitoxin module
MRYIILFIFTGCLTSAVFAQNPDQIDVSSFTGRIYSDTINTMVINGDVVNFRKEGTWTVCFNTGAIHLLVPYAGGLKNGVVVEIDRNGLLLSQTHYLNDTIHGSSMVFLGGSKLQLEENYLKGKLHGQRKVFYEQGKLQEASDYVDGNKSGKSIWYDENGKMLAEYSYLNGLFDGSQLVFYSNGKIKSEQWYSQNNLHGKNIQFFENGNKKLEGYYKNGRKAGDWTSFNEQGQIIEVQNFKE